MRLSEQAKRFIHWCWPTFMAKEFCSDPQKSLAAGFFLPDRAWQVHREALAASVSSDKKTLREAIVNWPVERMREAKEILCDHIPITDRKFYRKLYFSPLTLEELEIVTEQLVHKWSGKRYCPDEHFHVVMHCRDKALPYLSEWIHDIAKRPELCRDAGIDWPMECFAPYAHQLAWALMDDPSNCLLASQIWSPHRLEECSDILEYGLSRSTHQSWNAGMKLRAERFEEVGYLPTKKIWNSVDWYDGSIADWNYENFWHAVCILTSSTGGAHDILQKRDNCTEQEFKIWWFLYKWSKHAGTEEYASVSSGELARMCEAHDFARQNDATTDFYQGLHANFQRRSHIDYCNTIIDHFRSQAKGGSRYREVFA